MEKTYSTFVRPKQGTIIISLQGNLSYEEGTIYFRIKMRHCLEKGYRKFLIHFGGEEGVQSIDSSFISELFYYTKAVGGMEGGLFILVNMKDEVRTSLEATELMEKLVIAVDDPTMGRL